MPRRSNAVKLTKSKLKQIIKEEISRALEASEEEKERVEKILSNFTPEDIEILKGTREDPRGSIEDAILKSLRLLDDRRADPDSYRNKMGGPPDPAPDDEILNNMKRFIQGGYDETN
jgi:hypothetical protein